MFLYSLVVYFSLTTSLKFVSYIDQQQAAWGAVYNAELLTSWGVPGYSYNGYTTNHAYNYLNFAFWTVTKGCADACAPWLTLTTSITDSSIKQELTGKTSPTNSELQQAIMAKYHAAGIKVLISCFGATDHGVTASQDPTTLANTIATFVTDNNFDGVDLDWEDSSYLGGGAGEEWLVTLTTEIRSLLPRPYIITHAPQAPYFMGTPNYPYGGYLYVHEQVGDMIDWYNMQYYNQGNTAYETYTALFEDSGTESGSWSTTSAVFQIMAGNNNRGTSVSADQLVVGKPVLQSDAYNTGWLSASNFASYLTSAMQQTTYSWNTGFMTWQFYSDQHANDFAYSNTVSGVFGSPAPTGATPSPVPTTQDPTGVTPAPIKASDSVYIEVDSGSTSWFIGLWVREGNCNGYSSSDTSFANFIDTLEIASSTVGDNGWYTMTNPTWDPTKFVASSFQQQTTTPLSIRLTEVGGTVSTFSGLITSLSGCYAMALESSGTTTTPQPTAKPVTPEPTNSVPQPTAKPVTPQPTAKPVSPQPTTPEPTSSQSSDTNLYVLVGSGGNWYISIYINEGSCSGQSATDANYKDSISELYLQSEQSGDSSWQKMTKNSWGPFTLSPGAKLVYPLSLRVVTTDNSEISAIYIIRSSSSGECYDILDSGNYGSARTSSNNSNSSNDGVVIGSVIGGIIGLLLIVIILVCLFKSRSKAHNRKYSAQVVDVEMKQGLMYTPPGNTTDGKSTKEDGEKQQNIVSVHEN